MISCLATAGALFSTARALGDRVLVVSRFVSSVIGRTVGAMGVIRYAQRNSTRRPWLVQLTGRSPTKVAAIALANKTARTVWALMTSGDRYRDPKVIQAVSATA